MQVFLCCRSFEGTLLESAIRRHDESPHSGHFLARRANIQPRVRVWAAAALSGEIITLHTLEQNDSFVLAGSRGGTLFQLRKLIQFGDPYDPTICEYKSCDFVWFIDRFLKDAYSRLIESQFCREPGSETCSDFSPRFLGVNAD